jgi:short-subunit dehydrogenase
MQLFLPTMLQKKFGRIINVGSIAGKLPEQGIAVYSASKGYLDSITTSIYRDLRHSGVIVSILRAGPVKTEFFDAARNLKNGGSVPAERFAISADRVARKIWNLLIHPRRVAYVPFFLAVSPLLEILFSPVIDQVGPLLLRRRK